MMESPADLENSVVVGVASPPTNKVAAQLTKLRDANTKYKNLLKMAKERIEQQEQELKRLKAEAENQKENAIKSDRYDAVGLGSTDIGTGGEMAFTIVGIGQRIKVELEESERMATGTAEEIWALIEFETYDPDQQMIVQSKRSKMWKKFDSEAELSDFIRRDTGEPLKLPPYSLTPFQSAKIQDDAKKEVTKVAEEFRRFRVKSEMSRKQAESQIRELQNSNVESAKRRIEAQNEASAIEEDSDASRNQNSKIEKLRSEMMRQEVQWKEAYDVLMAENEALKSSSSQAMVASQWRQRYEICVKEKQELADRLKEKQSLKSESTDVEKYEMKYRELKESFRLYRKKAKEIFEDQQPSMSSTHIMQLSEKSNEDSKLSYLKNLMVNYLASDIEVREHMEGAIATVLNFTPEDMEKIEHKKNANGYFSIF